jgi:transposase
LGCGSQTARDAIHDFNERGLAALAAKSSRPKRTRDAFDEEGAEALRGMLHRSPREFGRRRSLWTLSMAAEVAFEEGLTQRRVSGETIRATLSRLLGIRWQRAKRWITSPDPLYERKKASFASDRLMEVADGNPGWAIGFQDECWWSRVALPALHGWAEKGEPLRLIERSVAKDDPDKKAISCYGLYLPGFDQTWISWTLAICERKR